MSLTCSDSMERAQRLNIENGCHSGLLKYKRRKVSVVRDFPLGCGRSVLQNNSIPIEGAASDTIENYLSGCHGVSRSMEMPKANNAIELTTKESNISCLKDGNNTVNVESSSLTDNLESKDGATDNYLLGCPGVSRSVEMLEANNALELTTKESNIYCLKDGHSTMNVESLSLTNNLEGKDGATENIINYAGVGASLKDLLEVVVSTRKEETLEPSKLRPCSPRNYSIFVSNGKDVKKAMVRRYPPRRKVSAIRDFPPFCGQNSPHLFNEVCSPAIASQNIRAIDNDTFELHYKSSNSDNVHQAKHNIVLAEDMTKLTMDKICTSMMVKPTKAIEMHDKCGLGNKCTVEKCTETSRCIQSKFDNKCESRLNELKESLEENLGKEIVAYTGDTTTKEKCSDMPSHRKQLEIEPFEQALASERVVVQGLMASPNCPWRQGKLNYKPSLGGGSSERKVTKRDYRQLEKAKYIIRNKDGKEYHRQSSKKKSTVKKDVDNGEMRHLVITGGMDIVVSDKIKKDVDNNGEMRQLVITGGMDIGVSDNENDDSNVNSRSCNTDVSLIPFSQINECENDHGSDSKGTRTIVRETLRLFQAVCRKLLQEEEAGKKVQGNASRRIDCIGAKILKDKGKYVNVGKQILGSVPGVEVGDEFRYRIELNIIGLHRQTQGGIDYVKRGQKILATSIVACGGYTNNLDNSDVLIYTGQGGNVMNSDKKPEDQKLERGNLALKNSFDDKSPVRVIRGSESSDGRTYVYDGLYLVEKWWQDMGPHGKLIFKFQLCRIPGQPELAWKELKKSKKFKVREGLCVDDISQGKESIRICAVNIIDDEKPPPFDYITKMIYPDWCHPIPLKGCDCTDGCSDSDRCYCAVLNGGEIPFNHNGAIVEAKSLVYECGPSCKCLPSCHNRVSQHGIKFQLEIFKTKSRGWGVRSLNSIPSGSFICEYIGELLEDKEAEQRTGNDEYLFDIGNNYSDNSLWDGLSTLLPDAQSNACDIVEDGSFTIDAANYGNIGRFINHSCSPNLYAQNVLYDHEDKRIPHIMFFAAENIPPLQELSYHYNYMMDQVRDSDGNIKKKRCYCGSTECTGWMY